MISMLQAAAKPINKALVVQIHPKQLDAKCVPAVSINKYIQVATLRDCMSFACALVLLHSAASSRVKTSMQIYDVHTQHPQTRSLLALHEATEQMPGTEQQCFSLLIIICQPSVST